MLRPDETQGEAGHQEDDTDEQKTKVNHWQKWKMPKTFSELWYEVSKLKVALKCLTLVWNSSVSWSHIYDTQKISNPKII